MVTQNHWHKAAHWISKSWKLGNGVLCNHNNCFVSHLSYNDGHSVRGDEVVDCLWVFTNCRRYSAATSGCYIQKDKLGKRIQSLAATLDPDWGIDHQHWKIYHHCRTVWHSNLLLRVAL